MVNANENKWEPVEVAALQKGDAIRVRPKGGTVWIPAQVDIAYRGAFGIEVFLDGCDSSNQLLIKDWHFERAVPERTLPTEPGLYVAASEAAPSDVSARVYWMPLGGSGFYDYSTEGIQYVQERDVPDDLVRLVPVAEVEAAEKRNHEAWNALEDYRRIGGQSSHRIITDIQKILDGKSKP